jgi:molybdopterin-containing oxidoreductase family membrane subunit
MIRRIKIIFDSVLTEIKRSPGFYVWVSFLVSLVFLGGYALLMSLFDSMEILEFYTNIPWEMMVSNYVFLVGSSIGLCIVSSLGDVFGLKRFKLIGKRALFMALIAIIFGLSSIGLHLGHPERGAMYNVLTPNLRSAMWWMGVFYPPYIVLAAVWYWLLARAELSKIAAQSEGLKARAYRLMALEGFKARLGRILPMEKIEARIFRLIPLNNTGLPQYSEGADLRWTRVVGALTLVFGLLAYGVEGSLFAHIEARPFWYGALYPIDFFLGATFCGISWFMAAGLISYKVTGEVIPAKLIDLFYEMAEILALLLSVGLLFTAYKMGHGLFEPAKSKIILLFLNGPFSLSFWLFEITIGFVLPILILLYAARKRKIAGLIVASIMVLAGYFVKRYDFVVASQAYPLIKKQYPLLSYRPTVMEILLIGGILGALFLIYTLGIKFLPLKEKSSHAAQGQ